MSKASIRRKIRQKEAEVRTCNRVIEKVRQEIRRMNQQAESWDNNQTTRSKNDMTNEVTIRNQYEGKTAIGTRERFFDSSQLKNSKNIETHDTVTYSEHLNYRIESRIDELRWEISDLYDRLHDDD